MTSIRLKTIDEVRGTPDSRLVIEGDWGGTIYCSCPVSLIGASQDEIYALAEWLERQFWACNFNDDSQGGHGVYYQVGEPGQGIWGGMGGGCFVDGLWVHPDIADEFGDEIIKRLKLKKV